ncbi:hypothetical protein [Fibrella forsythiae]|uniref:SH3 domain-containing protein n=1 Tax=Fibrella forsythiae TaxID=2817061 RepID=A0ABS3JCY4_9BACT|nr:hypothetical protein [Fibrella forsythiae]MBO0947855.1 hypothetical protein [Fibrella forsythiae]
MSQMQINHPKQMARFARLLVVTGLVLLAELPVCAQAYEGNLPVDPIRATNFFEPQPAETPYQEQVRMLQKQLLSEGKLLNELSVVDPSAYTALQSRLHTYLDKLEQQNPDYGQSAVHQSVRRFLQSSEEQTKAALAKGRRRLMESNNGAGSTEELVRPENLALVAYAPLFRKADFRSRRLHIVLPGEQITPLKKVGSYYLVRCGTNKGYVHEGMVQSGQQENARISMQK